MSRPTRLKILLVEDDFLIAMQLEAVLLAAGYDVLGPVATVRKALHALAEERPAAAILDVNLGDETAFPVADALAERAVPFVFCTGRDLATLPAAYRRRPMLRKPCDATELLSSLAQQLDSSPAAAN